MNIIKSYKNIQVRWIKQSDDSIWVVAKDICSILGLINNRQALTIIDSKYKSTATFYDVDSNQNRDYNIIKEPAIYELIFKSTKPEAKAFKEWVFEKVLPAIRKTGGFTLSEEDQETMRFMRSLDRQLELDMQYSEPPPGWDEMDREQQEEEEERLCGYDEDWETRKALLNRPIFNPEFIKEDLEDNETYQYYQENFPDLLPENRM